VTAPKTAEAEKVAGWDWSGGWLDPGRAAWTPRRRPNWAGERGTRDSRAGGRFAGGCFAGSAGCLNDQVSLILVEQRGPTELVTLVRFVAHRSLADRRP
jgi:hypothetical protein